MCWLLPNFCTNIFHKVFVNQNLCHQVKFSSKLSAEFLSFYVVTFDNSCNILIYKLIYYFRSNIQLWFVVPAWRYDELSFLTLSDIKVSFTTLLIRLTGLHSLSPQISLKLAASKLCLILTIRWESKCSFFFCGVYICVLP